MFNYIRNNYHFHLLLIISSLGFVFFYGLRGVYPIDSFIIFNSGYNVYNGVHPFKDYWSISGPILDYIQALFFLIFGLNWKSYVIHSLFINIIIVSISFYFFQKLKINNYFSFLYSLSIAILAYPQIGTPFMDHHAFYFSYLSIIFISLGTLNNRKLFWSLIPITLFISFFSKQIPSSYILVLLFIFLIYYLKNNKSKVKNIIKGLSFGTITTLFLFLLWIFLAEIPFENFILQYFHYPMSIADSRIEKIKFDANSFIFQYKFIYISLLIPLIYFIKNFKREIKNKNFTFNFFILNLILFFSFVFSQIITKNQVIIFFLIPYFLAVSHYFISINKGRSLYYYPVIILLVFITLKYHDRFNNSKKFMELVDANFDTAIDAEILDEKFRGLQWITNKFMDNPMKELKLLNESKKIMKKSNFNYIIVTDYQFFPLLLNLKNTSPAKWYDAMSVPNKKNIYHNKFKNYFITNLKKQKIDYIYLIGKDKYPLDRLFSDQNCVIFTKVNEILYLSNINKCY